MKVTTVIIVAAGLAAVGVVTIGAQQTRAPLAERQRSVQTPQRQYKETDEGTGGSGKHEVVLLSGSGSYFSEQYTNGSAISYVYGENGYIVYNADSSSGAPKYQGPIYVYTYDTNTHQSTQAMTNTPSSFSQAVADLLNDGYKIVNSSFNDQYGPAPSVLLVK